MPFNLFMKQIINLLLVCSFFNGYSQNFSIKSDNGSIFYLDQSHRVSVIVDGYDSSKITTTASRFGILNGVDGKYIVSLASGHLTQHHLGDSVRLDVFVRKEDGNYLVGSKTFGIARKNAFAMGLDHFRSGDRITTEQLTSLNKMNIAADDEWTLSASKGYYVSGYSCLVVPKKSGSLSAYAVVGDAMSPQIKNEVLKMEHGGRILFDDILLKNSEGEQKLGSSIFLIKEEKYGPYLYPISEKNSYSIDEVINLRELTVHKFDLPGSPIDMFQVTSFSVLVLPLRGPDEVFEQTGNHFSESLKKILKEKLKPGDILLFNQPTYVRPDGTYGICNSVRITIQD